MEFTRWRELAIGTKKKGNLSETLYFAINRPRAFGWSPPEPYLRGETNIV